MARPLRLEVADGIYHLLARGNERKAISHLRPPRPALANLLADDRPETIAAAYEHGYTMPAIARELGLHPSTISRRLARHAQIKT